MDQLEKPKISGRTWLWIVGGLAVATVLTYGMARNSEPARPSQMDRTEQALNGLWLDYTPSERFDFCAEARAAGYEVVADEIARARMMTESREVRYWLEDRCG